MHTLVRPLLDLIPMRTLWGLFHCIHPLKFLHRGTEPTPLGQDLRGFTRAVVEVVVLYVLHGGVRVSGNRRDGNNTNP